eukprot:scaffold4832_cov115-Skeletonema_dohrnii-CCMP3373.AAC.4
MLVVRYVPLCDLGNRRVSREVIRSHLDALEDVWLTLRCDKSSTIGSTVDVMQYLCRRRRVVAS